MDKSDQLIDISICIPTYNGGRYLEETLLSVLAQTFTNYEVIIVDDVSTDETLAICEKYQKIDSRITLYENKENLGLVGNWNRCLELSKGAWIKFVFQDDVLFPSCLDKMFSYSSSNQLIISSREFFFEKEISVAQQLKYFSYSHDLHITEISKISNLGPADFSTILCKYPFINIWGEPSCMLFKKAWIQDIGYFDEHLIQICDLEYWARIGSKFGAIILPEKLLGFRVHLTSTTSKNTSENSFKVNYLDYLHYYSKLVYHDNFSHLRKNTSLHYIFQIELLEIVFRIMKLSSATENQYQKSEIQKIISLHPKLDLVFKHTKLIRLVLLTKLLITHPIWILKDLKRRVREKINQNDKQNT